MTRLTFKEKWFIFWGYPYILNKKSLEIHDLRQIKKSCSIRQMSEHNKRYLSQKQFEIAITKGLKIRGAIRRANGCRWCLKKHDTG